MFLKFVSNLFFLLLVYINIYHFLLFSSFNYSIHKRWLQFGDEGFWEPYGSILTSFHPKLKRLKGKFERIKGRIGRQEVFVLFFLIKQT